MRTRIWVRAFRNDDDTTWHMAVKVTRHTEDGRLPRYATELYYTFGTYPTKADALRVGRSDARRLKRFIAKEGRIPRGRLLV